MIKEGSRITNLVLQLVIITLPFLVTGQQRPDTVAGKTILIDHMGRVIQDVSGAETIKWISGGLQLRIDSTYIYADSAVIYGDKFEGEKRLFAYGNVIIQQGDSLNVFTDTLYYSKENDIAHLTGEVALEQSSRQLWTNSLSYFLSSKYAEYNYGGVLIDNSLQVSSRNGSYNVRAKEAWFWDSVVVLHPKFNLAADSLLYQAAKKKVVFTGPTNFYTKSSRIYCEGGFYDLDTEIAEFNLDPQYSGGTKKATADTIRYFESKSEAEMIGNVYVEDEDRIITGTYLRYAENTGETRIKGHPAIYQDSIRTLKSSEIFFNEKTNELKTTGKGEVQIEDKILTADEAIIYDEVTGFGQATGNVEMRDTVQNIGIRGEVVDFNLKTNNLLASGPGRALFYTVIEGDTLFIAADTLKRTMEIDSSTGFADTMNIMRMYNDVRIYKSDMQGRMDSLVYDDRDSLFTYFGQPVLWSDTTQFSGDTIYMTLRDKKIHEVILNRGALIVSEILDTYYDQIKGKQIVAQFDSSEIKTMTVNGNAESIYYTRDDESAFIGVNKTICSKMFFSFLDGEIHLLKYFGENSSSLLPMYEAEHDRLRLEGFQWREGERPRNYYDLLK